MIGNLRWNAGRSSYRPPAETIRPDDFGVELLEEAPAKRFVTAHHYSRSYPAARCRVGLFRRRPGGGTELAGVAVFSVPAQPRAITRWLGVQPAAGVELGRFVLLDDVAGNGETWFLRRAFRELRKAKPDVRAVLSYSDPLERRADSGAVVTPGHVGTIYQAFNGSYLGRSRPGVLILDAAARPISPRSLSKVRLEERGAAGAEAQLVRAGAPPRRFAESGPDYAARAVREGPFRTVRHPGNHVYAWALDGRAALPPSSPYPKLGPPSAVPPPRLLA